MKIRVSEHESRVREFWVRAYDNLLNNNKNDNKLPYEPTAVLGVNKTCLSKPKENDVTNRKIFVKPIGLH